MAKKKAKAIKLEPAPQAPERCKLNLSLEPLSAAKIRAYAGFLRQDVSVVVARAVDAEMKAVGFTVYVSRSAGGNSPIIEPAYTPPLESLRIAPDEPEDPDLRRVG